MSVAGRFRVFVDDRRCGLRLWWVNVDFALYRLWCRVPAAVRRPIGRARSAIGRAVAWCLAPFRLARCLDCERVFDRRDPRALIHKRGKGRLEGLSVCPACRLQGYEGVAAWAVKNDCNGIFDDMVFVCRSDAQAKAATFDPDQEMYAVPCRIYEERDELAVAMRHRQEHQNEAIWAAQARVRGEAGQ